MKKFIMKQELRMMEKAAEAKKAFMKQANEVLTSDDGFTLTTEKLLWALLIAVIVIGIGVLVFAMIKGEIFPALSNKIKEILSMN